MISTLTCALCHVCAKSTQHLFIECEILYHVWIGILFVQHEDLKCHF